MRSLLVMVSGWKSSGKDTLASRIVSKYGFKQVAFASLLKDMVAEQYGVDRSWMDDTVLKEAALPDWPVSPRDAFSSMVTEFMKKEFKKIDGKEGLFWTPRALLIMEGSIKRTANPNYWVDVAADACRDGGLYVISDARYRNEISRMQLHFHDRVKTVRVERFDDCISTDPSERDLDAWDFNYKISNRGSKEEFYSAIDYSIESILDGR